MYSDFSVNQSEQKRDSKIQRISKGSNHNDLKQKYKNKLQKNTPFTKGNTFATRFQSSTFQSIQKGFAQTVVSNKQNSQNGFTAQKSSSKEDDDDVVPNENDPVSASMLSDV